MFRAVLLSPIEFLLHVLAEVVARLGRALSWSSILLAPAKQLRGVNRAVMNRLCLA